MKPILFIPILILFISCQKENDDVTPPPVNEGTLLKSAVTTFGSDSYSYGYAYGSSNELNKIDFSSQVGGVSKTDKISVFRNGGGIIESYSYKSTAFAALGLDSILYKVGYNASEKIYTYTVGKYVAAGTPYADSTAFIYSAGNVIDVKTFSSANGGAYKNQKQQVFTYNSGNIASNKGYTYNSATSQYVLKNEFVYEYDTKVNPLAIKDEGHVLGILELVSANNSTKGTYTDQVNSANNYIMTWEYTYNSKNKPLTSVIKYPGSNVTLQTTFNY